MENIVVSAETQEGERDTFIVVTLEGTSWQLKVRANPSDWERLASVPDADWNERRAVRLGMVEGSAAWWHISGDALHLNIGDGGPEESDLGFVVPLAVFRELHDQVAAVDEGWG